jgi:hypothetical protein
MISIIACGTPYLNKKKSPSPKEGGHTHSDIKTTLEQELGR